MEQRKANSPANGLPAFAGGVHCDAASMNDTQVGRRGVRFDQASRAKKLGNLLAFIVIDPASQCFDGKGFHERRSVKLIEELIAVASVILDASRGRVKVADC